jgi:hypothetical protein
LIMLHDANRLDVLPATGPRGRMLPEIVKFRSLCPVPTFENPPPNRDVDTSESQFVALGLFDTTDGEITGQTIPSVLARNRSKHRSSLNHPSVIRLEESKLVPGIRRVGNSGALSLEPFEMSGLNFQVSTRCWDTGSIGARKIE